jgi:pilus assembly protein CpaF
MDVAAFVETVQAELLSRLDLRRNDVHRMPDAELRELAARCIRDIIAMRQLPAGIDRARLERQLLQEVVGQGVLEDLLEDDAVTEIMVNGPQRVFVERQGVLAACQRQFSSALALARVIERLLLPTGRRVDEASPMVDARLADGSRINVVVPPLCLQGAAVTIRKFGRDHMTLAALVAAGSLSPDMAVFLRLAVRERCNIVVSGGTGAGKTTLLNALAREIPPAERIVTIEDSAELQLAQPNLVALQARPSNLEGQGQVSIRDLLRNALRMRPDRIVIGECRGGEALDMLQAMNTGHNGSLTTAHANSPRDVLSRLEVMVLMAGMDLPATAIREQIASAVDLIIQQSRFASGARRIVRITEVTGMEAGRIQTQDLFRFEACAGGDAGDGRYAGCGNTPVFYEALAERGLPLDRAAFDRCLP